MPDVFIGNFEQIQRINPIKDETIQDLSVLGYKKGVKESPFRSFSSCARDKKPSQGLFWL